MCIMTYLNTFENKYIVTLLLLAPYCISIRSTFPAHMQVLSARAMQGRKEEPGLEAEAPTPSLLSIHQRTFTFLDIISTLFLASEALQQTFWHCPSSPSPLISLNNHSRSIHTVVMKLRHIKIFNLLLRATVDHTLI